MATEVRTGRAASARVSAPAKIAITIRLDPARADRLQAIAEAENRTLTNYVETALIHDLARREEAMRVITVRAAPGTSQSVSASDIVRAEGEADTAYAKRQTLLTELWSISDSD